MKITEKKKDALNLELTLEIVKDDYAEKERKRFAQLRRTADKPMFLIAGKFDDDRSRSALLPGDGFFNHATGHTPTAEANLAAWDFLDKVLK